MRSDFLFPTLVIGTPVVLFWLLALLPRRAGGLLSLVAIALLVYAAWFALNDPPKPNQLDLGPSLRVLMALAALAGPLMALAFHLIGRRSWRWRMACFAAGFPLGHALIRLQQLF
jgi:hypothetical protein